MHSRDKQGPPDYPDQGQPHRYPNPNQQQPQQQPQQQHPPYPQGGYIHNWARPYHPQQHPPMDENSSGGGNGLARTESGMSDKPLSDGGCRELERTMAQEGYSASMLGQFQTSTNPPSVQQQGMVWTGEGGEGVFQPPPPPPLRQADTLEANPLMVNPMEVQQQHQQPSQASQQPQQAVIQTNPDGTFVIPLSQTPSGTDFFRTESGSQYRIVETPDVTVPSGVIAAVKQEQAGAPYTPLVVDPMTHHQQQHQSADAGVTIEDAWSSLVEANNDYNLRGGGAMTPGQGGGVPSAPTGDNPVFKPWPGHHEFAVTFQKLTENAKNKSWDYSTKLKKLFIDANKEVMACFTVRNINPEGGYFIRMLPVYAESQSFKNPVTRCPNHAGLDHPWNKDFNLEYRHHLMRAINKATCYEEDHVSKRLSCKFPVDIQHFGNDQITVPIKFMCLGSDVGGINRRALMVIFTLESSSGEVCGRAKVDVRICSCPRRDKHTEEEKKAKDEAQIRKQTEQVFGRTNSFVLTTTPSAPAAGKKRKLEHPSNVDEMVMVPVARCDFEHLNYMAEACMVAKNPAKKDEIKAARRRLLEHHNPNTFKRVKKDDKVKKDK